MEKINFVITKLKNKKIFIQRLRYIFIKRYIDLIFSIIVLILFSPLFIVVGILVFLNFGAPILFIQERPGFKNMIFKMYKFRSMKILFNNKGNLMSDEKRINKFGIWLRSTSLDEIPEIINVLKGEMSFVGPRPLLVEYLKYYNDQEIKRHNVKPGITGLAQVNGRNTLTWEKKFEYDIYYSKNISFLLDLKILLLTIYKVFSQRDINQTGSVTPKNFKR